MIEPLNTEWNRKTGILPQKGQTTLLGVKHGIIYFTWTATDDSVMFLQCDEGVFNKHFSLHGADLTIVAKDTEATLEAHKLKKIKFLKYPFEVPVLK